MLYTLTKESKYSLNDSAKVHKFNYDNVIYIDDNGFNPFTVNNLVPYIPTTEAQSALLEEYSNFVTETKKVVADYESDSKLMELLEGITYWKNLKSKQLNEVSDAFEANLNRDMYFISSLGFKANGDRRTANNIANLINMFDIASGEKGTVSYRDYDNVDHELNKAQLSTLLQEHIGNGNALYSQKWVKKEAIKNASTLDDLAAISLDFEMKDYTQESIQQALQSSNQKRDVDHKTTLSSILKL